MGSSFNFVVRPFSIPAFTHSPRILIPAPFSHSPPIFPFPPSFPFPRKRESPDPWCGHRPHGIRCRPCVARPAPATGRFPLSREWGVCLILLSAPLSIPAFAHSSHIPIPSPFFHSRPLSHSSTSPFPPHLHSPISSFPPTSPFPPHPHSLHIPIPPHIPIPAKAGISRLTGAGRATLALHRFFKKRENENRQQSNFFSFFWNSQP